MTMPLAYMPEQGYMYQILTKHESRPWEHCDYAKDKADKDYLLTEYKLAYRGQPFQFKFICLPQKYWEGMN